MKALPLLLITLLSLSKSASGENAGPYDPSKFFRIQILPILQARCFECHSKEHEIEGELALDSKAAWVRGGESGPAITPGDLKKSLLIQAIRHLDDESAMPPKEKLPAIEIALLETWVLLGAPDPR